MPWMLSPGIERLAHLLHRLQKLRETFEREELALQRHQDRVRRRHRIDGQQIERGRTVDQHVSEGGLLRPGHSRVGGAQLGERIAQAEGAVARLADLELEAGEVDGRGSDEEPRYRGRENRRPQRGVADQHVIGRGAPAGALDAEAGRGVALGIEIDDQHFLADRGQRGAEIDRGGGLADPALLIGDRQNARSASGLASCLASLGSPAGSKSERRGRTREPRFSAYARGASGGARPGCAHGDRSDWERRRSR